jgi:hypothetical protein
MAGLVPAIHVFAARDEKDVMPGTRPGMTRIELSVRKPIPSKNIRRRLLQQLDGLGVGYAAVASHVVPADFSITVLARAHRATWRR